MTRDLEEKLVHQWLASAFRVVDGWPTTPGQIMFRDTLIGALQEAHVLFPAAEEREQKQRKKAND